MLTPGHFLNGDSLLVLPGPNLLNIRENRLKRWDLMQTLYQEFWKRWNNEYLARLQQRPKWKTSSKNLEVGNLVLIRDEGLPPTKWLMGRIIDTQPGKDGHTRVVTIKNKNTIMKRPITKVCLLAIEDNMEETLNTPNEIETKGTIRPTPDIQTENQISG